MPPARFVLLFLFALALASFSLPVCTGGGSPDGGDLAIVEAKPTVFFVRVGDGELQLVRVGIENRSSETMQARVRAAASGRTVESDAVEVPAGERVDVEVGVTPAAPGSSPRATLAVLDGSGSTRARARLSLPYQRRWKLYMAPFSHLDVGFTQSQANVLAKQKRGLDKVIDLIEETAGYPEGSRFRFTVEQSWPLVEYLADPAIPEGRKERLLAHAREGEIEVAGFFNGHINKFVGDEQLVRSLYFSAERIRREHGIEVVSAMLNDVGDASSVVQILARAGIRYFQYGPNTIHYPLPALFTLSPPNDRASRVLTWLTPIGGYGENLDLGLRPPLPANPTQPHDPNAPVSFDDYRAKLERHFTALQETGLPLPSVAAKYSFGAFRCPYPYDAYFLTYYPAHDGDNGIQDRLPSDIAKDWNEKYVWPRLVVSTMREFFEYVERDFASEIPELVGDFEGFWGEQIFFADEQVDPSKEARNRAFDFTMGAAEAFSSVALALDPAFPFDRESVRSAYQGILLNNDHNPGPVPISGSHYTDEDVEDWKRAHREWDLGSAATASGMLDRAIGALAGRIGRGGGRGGAKFAVFNPSSWERSGLVEAPVPGPSPSGGFAIRDVASGESLPVQGAGGGRVVFLARGVPALGYRSYGIEEGAAPAAGPSTVAAWEDGGEIVLENDAYRVRIPSESSGEGAGGITSLFDKALGREIVDRSTGRTLGQYTVALRGEAVGLKQLFLESPGFSSASASIVESGPLRARVRIEGVYDDAIETPAVAYLVATVLTRFVAPPGTPAPPRKSPAPPVTDVVLVAGEKRVEIEHSFVSPPEQSLDNMIAYPFLLPGFEDAVVSHPFNPVRAGPKDPYGARGVTGGPEGESFVTIPLKPSALNTFNATFLWIEGAPPDTMFRSFVDFSAGSYGVTVASRESGMAVVGGLERDGFSPVVKPILHHLLVGPTFVGTVLFGNEGGETFSFHTALTSHAGDGNSASAGAFGGEASAERFGRAWQSPLRVVELPSGGGGDQPPAAGFLSIDSPNLVVSAVKPAEDGRGIILRILETSGADTTARVAMPGLAASPFAASLTTDVERDLEALPTDPATSSVEVRAPAYGLITVRVE